MINYGQNVRYGLFIEEDSFDHRVYL